MASPNASTEVADKLMTPANIVTLTRICLVPLFVIAFISPWPEWFGLPQVANDEKSLVAAAIFVIISCTDWLDGYLARSRGEVTNFGKFMDPLADKILVTAALLALIELGTLPSWIVLVILTREFIVSGVRMMAASEGVVIAASWYGKFKTVFQMIAIVLFTIKDSYMVGTVTAPLGDTLWVVSWLVMIIALILTIVSMMDYIVKARELIGLGPRNAARTQRKKVKRSEKRDGAGPSESGERSALAAETSVAAGKGAGPNAQGGLASPENNACRTEAGEVASAAAPLEERPGLTPIERASIQPDEMDALAQKVIEAAVARNITLGTAESLTGGLIAGALTAVSGSSAVVKGSVVSYAVSVKEAALGVSAQTIQDDGVVSEQTALAMATGALDVLGCDLAVAVTGIAGPTGAEPGKPVGTVWLAVASRAGSRAQRFCFPGNRREVRLLTVHAALSELLGAL